MCLCCKKLERILYKFASVKRKQPYEHVNILIRTPVIHATLAGTVYIYSAFSWSTVLLFVSS